MLILVSTLALILIGLGWKFRRRVEIHIPLMMSAFATDIGLLLYIEWQRHALETLAREAQAPVHHPLLVFHVTFSVLTLLLYLAQLTTGILLIRGNPVKRTLHRRIGYCFLFCRLMNYGSSFFMPGI